MLILIFLFLIFTPVPAGDTVVIVFGVKLRYRKTWSNASIQLGLSPTAHDQDFFYLFF